MNASQKLYIRRLAIMGGEAPTYWQYLLACDEFNEVLDYREFDYWWHKFKTGFLDLNEETPQFNLSLTDMPNHLLEKIFGNLDFKSLCIVKKMSRNFRQIAQNLQPPVVSLIFRVSRTRLTMWIDNSPKIQYFESDDGDTVVRQERRIKFLEGNHVDLAFRDFGEILGHPQLNLDSLKLIVAQIPVNETDHSPELRQRKMVFFQNMTQILQSRQSLLPVESLEMSANDSQDIAGILRSLKPGNLKQLELTAMFADPSWKVALDMRAVALLDQWKQLKRLYAIPVAIRSKLIKKSLDHLRICHVSVSRIPSFSRFMDFIESPITLATRSLYLESVEPINAEIYDDFINRPIQFDYEGVIANIPIRTGNYIIPEQNKQVSFFYNHRHLVVNKYNVGGLEELDLQEEEPMEVNENVNAD